MQGTTTVPVELLEGRRLLSATLEGGVLTVTGTAGPDIIQLNLADEDTIAVGIVGSSGMAFPRDEVNLVVVRGLGGDDWLLVGDGSAEDGEPAFNVPLVLDGGPGDDLLSRGPRATTPATFHGGPGNDTINAGGGGGVNLVHGGPGDDDITGGPGTDIVFGGAGDDTILGGDGDDILVGGPGDDDIDGGAGADVVLQ
ncbi:MAG TPA: hypothetical protein VFB66_31040 [Tepidisphaeraceae bacterium]|nr:hypothetical protein [Tepidisphaeraceae bacterium]